MTVPKRVIPASNLPPESEAWGREQQAIAEANRDSLNSLSRQSEQDYKQLNIAVDGAASRTIAARNVVYATPGAYISRDEKTNFALPATTWVPFGEVQVPQVRNKSRVTVFITATISIMVSSMVLMAPEVYVAVSVGNNNIVYTPTPLIDYSTVNGKVFRQGQVTHSATYMLDRTSPSVGTIFAQLYASEAVAASPDTRISVYSYMLYGGSSTL